MQKLQLKKKAKQETMIWPYKYFVGLMHPKRVLITGNESYQVLCTFFQPVDLLNYHLTVCVGFTWNAKSHLLV